jgi:hypothetical protein
MRTQYSMHNLDSCQEMLLGLVLFVYIHCSFDAIWIPLPRTRDRDFRKSYFPFHSGFRFSIQA